MKNIYFMPGMAANCLIFEHLKLDSEKYNLHYIEWIEPNKNEPLQDYCNRIAQKIKHPNPVLIGVSFGGIVVQEISKQINAEKVIIISSVKDFSEFPPHILWARKWKLFRFFPTSLFNPAKKLLQKAIVSKKKKHRLAIYDKYLTFCSKNYLDWAFKNVILWENKNPLKNVYHLHGRKDFIFPAKKIKNAFFIENGTHVMILTHAKGISKKLIEIIEK